MSHSSRGVAIAFLIGSAVEARSVEPVRFRIVEVNTSACEWSGEPSFTCREVLLPFGLDVRFEPGVGRRLAISVDGESAAELSEPGEHAFPPGSLSPGRHRLELSLHEGESVVWRHAFRIDVGRTITEADLPPPFVAIASPATGKEVSGEIEIAVRAHNPRSLKRQVDRVEVLVDGALLARLDAEPWTVRWDTTPESAGPHRISARALGSRGQWSETSTDVRVLSARSLLPERSRALYLASPGTASVAFDIPAGSSRVVLETRLDVLMRSKGLVKGILRDEEGRSQTLFALQSEVTPPIPMTRDLSGWRGRVTLELLAQGGGELRLDDLDVRSYR